MSTALSKPYKLTAADKEAASWLTNAGLDDTKSRLAKMTGTPADLAVLTLAIETEQARTEKRSSRLKPMEAALRKLSKSVATLALQGESTGPDWTRARSYQEGIKFAFRVSLAGQILLGQELQTLKVELGFVGRGGDRRSKPHDAVLKSLNRTWDQWCKSELNGTSADTADRLIQTYEGAKAKLKKLGGQPRLIQLLETPPAKLDDEAHKTLREMVDKIEWGDSQKALLEDYRIAKAAAKIAGGDTSKSSPKKTELEAEQLAFAFFGKATSSITKLEKHVQNLRVAPDYEGFLHTLPLHREGPDGLSLHGLKLTLEAALTGDLPKMLEDVKAAIAAAEKSAAA